MVLPMKEPVMAAPERRPRRQPAPHSDTWVTFALEIARSVLPDRSRTVNAILLLTVPLAAVAATVTTIVLVLIPHPTMVLGALLSSAGVSLTAWLRRRLDRRATPPHLDGVADDPESPDPSNPQLP
ncbi:hypothetical protein OG601_39135 [Streptomyces sp. NBC_01239]|uniref:hypothetical protein n=1 Tax=Streptomyces sp. NBC_01239 TaxID=2903792 RepID=UPI0022531409|nr:hypothetical protein [Streptomyces sp. NBC_01239]MCX4816621.1 hypothetical protein [Streptomyces sp. NBC_01239]